MLFGTKVTQSLDPYLFFFIFFLFFRMPVQSRFCVVKDIHLEDKIRNKKWWEDRGHKLGRVGEWLFLCTSSVSSFVPSSVVIAGLVVRHEIVDGMYTNAETGSLTYRTYFSETYVVNVSIGRVVGEGKPRASTCPILADCARRVLAQVVKALVCILVHLV